MKLYFRVGLTVLCVWGGLAGRLAAAASGTEGASFLDIPVGARPAALGSAYTALAGDAYGPVWNPAGLGFVDTPQIAAQHLAYLDSIHDEFLSGVMPLGAGKALGVSAQYLGSGDINGTNRAGDPIGAYSDRYGAYAIAYGQKITPTLSFGATGKWVNAQLADVSANAYAADLGALDQVTDKLRLAATVTNIGTPLKFSDQGDSLPLSGHLGFAYRATRQWLLSMEGVYSKSGLMSGRVGVEWSPMSLFSLRAGYRTDTLKELSALAGLSAGFGIKVFGQELAYAWVPYGDLGDTQYFSFLLRFGTHDDTRNLIQHETIWLPDEHKKPKATSSDPELDQLIELLNDRTQNTAENPKPEGGFYR